MRTLCIVRLLLHLLRFNTRVKHSIMGNCMLPSFSLSCTSEDSYWFVEMNRSIISCFIVFFFFFFFFFSFFPFLIRWQVKKQYKSWKNKKMHFIRYKRCIIYLYNSQGQKKRWIFASDMAWIIMVRQLVVHKNK